MNFISPLLIWQWVMASRKDDLVCLNPLAWLARLIWDWLFGWAWPSFLALTDDAQVTKSP